MNKVFALAAFAVLVSSPAFAAEQAITIGGTAQGGITLPSGLLATGGVTGNATGGGTSVTITNLTDNQGYASATPFTLSFGTTSAGYQVYYGLKSTNGGFTLGNTAKPTPANAGYTNRITYKAVATWDGAPQASLAATEASAGVYGTPAQTTGATSGVLRIQVAPNTTSPTPLQPGVYGDILSVKIASAW